MDKQKCLVLGEASESDEENVLISVVGDRGQKKNFLQGTVVPGEAPESGDEDGDVEVQKVRVDLEDSEDVEGKEREDDEDEDSCSSASEAFMSRAAAATTNSNASNPSVLKYNTLLHRKLYESNLSLQRGIYDLLSQPLHNASQKLNLVNQQLLTSQVEIQDAVSTMKRSYNTFMKLDNTLGAVLAMPYLPNISIKVPPKNLTS